MNVVTDIDEGNARRNTLSAVQTESSLPIENEESYKTELQIWIQRAIAYCLFFIILQVSLIANFSADFSLTPLILLDLKIITFTYLSRRPVNFFRFVFCRVTIHQVLSLSFKILLLIYNNTHWFNALFLPIPLALVFFNQYFHKIEKTQECKYLSWLVRFIQVVTTSEFLFVITILNVSMSQENVVNWKPSGVIWPVYIGLCFCAVIIVGLVLFCLGSFLSWASEEIPMKEFISSFWLLGSALGATLSILCLCLSVAKDPKYRLEKYYSICPIVFLLIFIGITQLYIKEICEWWKIFFLTSQEVELLNVSHQTSSLNFRSNVSSVMKKAPHMLMRISSSYFKPIDTPKGAQIKRTISLKEEVDGTVVEHKRHHSIPMKVEVFSPTAKAAVNKLCEMCCERLCNAVIMDCGHGGICYECSLEMWKTVGTCHMCRGTIAQVLQIEKSKDSLVRVQSSTKAVYTEQIDEE